MVGVGIGGAFLVDRFLLPLLQKPAGADAGTVAVAPAQDVAVVPAAADVVPSEDAGAQPVGADAAPPAPPDAEPDLAPDAAAVPVEPDAEVVEPEAAVDGAPVAIGEAVFAEYQYRTREDGDPLKVFSWAEVEVDLDGVVGDLVLEVDLRNCPHDTDGRLVSPAGTSILLWSDKGSTKDWLEVQGAFPDVLVPLDSLCPLRGEPVRGPWRLRIGDSQRPCRVLLRTGKLIFQPPTRPCPPPEESTSTESR
jgi:hypothetical protein